MRRRSLAILAAMAMGVSALAVAAPANATGHLDGAPYVALGDSIAAGTGNQPYVDPSCLRSAKAYPELLGDMLGTGVASTACAGATTDHMQQWQLGNLGTDTQLVTITAGLNNIDWQSLLLFCSTVDAATCAAHIQAAEQYLLATLPSEIVETTMLVRQAAPNAQIVFTGYPLLFGDFTGMCSIGVHDGAPVKVSDAHAALINQAIAGVNALIWQTVASMQDPSVAFVDVTAVFDGHGLCDTGSRWISGLVPSDRMAARSLHPNSAGQQAYASYLYSLIAPSLQG